MKRFVVLITVVAAAFVALTATSGQALAAQHPGPSATRSTGNDVSWPQCGKTLPTGQAFGIVGVNGGKANNVNSCFAAEWQWAAHSTGASTQVASQLYVNTGNPGDVLTQYNVTDWPQSSVGADPYGACAGGDDKSCSWEYGYERAQADVATVTGAGVTTARPWWLDIETSNSWTADPAKNQASLEGMVYELQSQGGTVGIYSSSTSWSSLFGPVASSSTLYRLPEWRPGASSLRAAQSNCTLQPFEGIGKVTLTQYVSNNLDYDYSCG